MADGGTSQVKQTALFQLSSGISSPAKGLTSGSLSYIKRTLLPSSETTARVGVGVSSWSFDPGFFVTSFHNSVAIATAIPLAFGSKGCRSFTAKSFIKSLVKILTAAWYIWFIFWFSVMFSHPEY